MCVIVVQNKAKFPGWETLKNCWESNPHGAGFMYRTGDKIVISKGYMNWDQFNEAVKQVPNFGSRDMVFHFRIASHGKVQKENTHPYPFSPSVNALNALDLVAPVGIAHNGIIDKSSYSAYVQEALNITDTAQFIRERYQVLKNNNYVKKSALSKTLEDESKLSGSKFVLMDQKEIKTYGTWTKYKDCLFSNGYSHYKKVYHTPKSQKYTPWFESWEDKKKKSEQAAKHDKVWWDN